MRIFFGKNLLVTILLACVSVCWGESKPTMFYLYATGDNRSDFLEDFSQEPACHGLVVGDDTTIRVHYYGDNFEGTSHHFFGFIVKGREDVNFRGRTGQEAVKSACRILKGVGGSVQ